MTESSSNVASHILPGHQTHTLAGHQRCQISQKYAVSFEDISAAFFYASCRLLAIHRIIKIDPTFHSQNPADFYKNMSWEVDANYTQYNHQVIQIILVEMMRVRIGELKEDQLLAALLLHDPHVYSDKLKDRQFAQLEYDWDWWNQGSETSTHSLPKLTLGDVSVAARAFMLDLPEPLVGTSQHSGIAAVRSDIEDHVRAIQSQLRHVGKDLNDLLMTGLHHIRVTNDEMTEVVGPIPEVADAMQAAEEVINYVIKYGYK